MYVSKRLIMEKAVVINQTILLIIAIFSLVVLIMVYVFVSGVGGEWIDAIRQIMAFNSPSP